MPIIQTFKKSAVLSSAFSALCQIATLISPTLNTELRYFSVFGKRINLKTPQSFCEKLLWLKLKRYNHDPLVIQCADKYRVRDYIKKCGYEYMLNGLISVYESPEQIDWDQLPNRFVMKTNFGAGMIVICRDKSKLDTNKAARKLKKWMKRKVWLLYSEMQYKYAPKCIVCEEFLEDEVFSSPPDYKIYCFHGQPMATLVVQGRRSEAGIFASFYDNDWNELKGYNKHSAAQCKKPDCLDEILEASRKLSEPFPFVRCDFYIVNGKPYFGEMTFTPAGGLYTSQVDIHGKNMTEYLTVP